VSTRLRIVFTLCSLVVLGFYSATASGQCTLSSPTSWQTSGSGQWLTGSNWSGGVPTSSTNACITNGTSGTRTVVNLAGGAGTVNSLQLGGFDTVNFSDHGLEVFGTQIINDGQINMASGTVLFLDGSTTLSGAGTITESAGAFIGTQIGGGTLTNQSTIQGAGNIGDGSLDLINEGTVNANTNGQILSLFIGSGYTNTGTLEATNGGILQIEDVTVNDQNGTMTAGAGSSIELISHALVSGGTFFNNLGTLSIDNTSTFVVGTGAHSGTGYIQLANGMLNEMIASNSSFGVINVSGSALLNGTLDILLQGGFGPSVGSTYKILLANAGQINGTFSSIENDTFTGGPEAGAEKWLVDYDSAGGYVELIAEPLPEPGILFVLMPGLLGAGFMLRRQLFR
jgi:fibronectin-binding autotransporter adhesin